MLGLVENQSNWYIKKLSYGQSIWLAIGRGFNTGVMLMNLKKLREFNFNKIWTRITKQVLMEVHETVLADQDIMNSVIKKHSDIVVTLDCVWNVQLSDHTQSETCYKNSKQIKILHWNLPRKQEVQNKHAIDFNRMHKVFLEMDGNLLRRQLFQCSEIKVDNNTNKFDDCTKFTMGSSINKVSFITHLTDLGYKYIVLPDAFIIHRPHAPSLDIAKFRTNTIYRRCLKKLKDKFVDELINKFGKNTLSKKNNDQWEELIKLNNKNTIVNINEHKTNLLDDVYFCNSPNKDVLAQCHIDAMLRKNKYFTLNCEIKLNQHNNDDGKCCNNWSPANYVAFVSNRTSCLGLARYKVSRGRISDTNQTDSSDIDELLMLHNESLDNQSVNMVEDTSFRDTPQSSMSASENKADTDIDKMTGRIAELQELGGKEAIIQSSTSEIDM
ncbi:hypothetical protein HCN44_003496 [Aphidius gifuensis]|uniref:Uncharacterized protein n=1 Tax=Aphidius gifuensis TaxID=684658 RepID=A0A835CN03_APHGI|nr:hypothetical protein HCN44_003496 [Aphidius gifuensis]